MARLCAGVMAFVLLFRANRLLVSAKAQLGTRQHYPLLWFRPAERIPARALGAAVIGMFSQMGTSGCVPWAWSRRACRPSGCSGARLKPSSISATMPGTIRTMRPIMRHYS